MLKILIFVYFLFSTSILYANSCRRLLSGDTSTEGSQLAGLLAPLSIENLVQNVDFQSNGTVETLNPSTDVVVYSSLDNDLLADKNFPFDELSPRDRIIETDYGYAVMDVEELRDWTLLQHTIADPSRAQAFINQVANTQGLFPRGITNEAAEWLRWSVFAQYDAIRKAEKNIINKSASIDDFKGPFGMATDFWQEKRAAFRRLVRQKELIVFPFGQDVRYDPNIMTDYDAQNVLAILVRHFLISNLYVPRSNGEYIKLSEFLDRDSLMLMSRFPALLPAYSVFEDGHFSIEHMFTFVGRDDSYNFSEKLFPVEMVEGQPLSNLFVASARGGDLTESESVLSLDAYFLVSFDNEDEASGLSSGTIEEAFSREVERIDAFLTRKSSEFEKVTGYSLPVSTVIEDDFGDYTRRDYIVSFGDQVVPPHVLAAFYVFAGLHN